jgi:hypothetical protein
VFGQVPAVIPLVPPATGSSGRADELDIAEHGAGFGNRYRRLSLVGPHHDAYPLSSSRPLHRVDQLRREVVRQPSIKNLQAGRFQPAEVIT